MSERIYLRNSYNGEWMHLSISWNNRSLMRRWQIIHPAQPYLCFLGYVWTCRENHGTSLDRMGCPISYKPSMIRWFDVFHLLGETLVFPCMDMKPLWIPCFQTATNCFKSIIVNYMVTTTIYYMCPSIYNPRSITH